MQNKPEGQSALGLDANITTAIGYIIPLIALILIFIEKDNKFVRYHSFQSILWVAVCTVVFIAIIIIGSIFGFIVGMASSSLAFIIGLLFVLIYIGLFLGYVGGLIYGAVKSYGGSMFKLPVIGDMAAKWSN